MCGIYGVFGDRQFITPEQLGNHLLHRGPDDQNTYQNEQILIGHTRLSILDLSSKGRQPFTSSCGRYILSYNGELYNYLAIKKELIQHYQFKSDTDTEVLLAAWIQWNSDCLSKLSGIYSFAIYDKQEKELTLVRDPMGVKPLYYYHTSNTFIFASEIKPIALQLPQKTLDFTAIEQYISFGYSLNSTTPYLQIKRVLPGETIVIKYKKEQIAIITSKITTKQAPLSLLDSPVDTLNDLLIQSVEKQLQSHAPLGFFLSGGLDSSLIVKIASGLTDKPIDCFTINTDNNEGFSSDLNHAKDLAQRLHVKHHLVHSNPNLFEVLNENINQFDEPIGDTAALNTLFISQAASDLGIKVMLSGTGADELFGGYRRHLIEYYQHYKFLLSILSPIIKHLPFSNGIKRRVQKLHQSYKSDNYISLFQWLLTSEMKKLFLTPLESATPQLPQLSTIQDILNFDVKEYLPSNNLIYNDKFSMLNGIETRVPFLDEKIVSFSQQLPIEYKIKNNTLKYILKEVAQRHLPRTIVNRKKTGFGLPLRDYIINNSNYLKNEVLNKNSLDSTGIFSALQVHKLIDLNKKGVIDASQAIWNLVTITKWLQTHHSFR